MINQSWFKVITIVLIVYVFTAGMLRPLNPGILEIDQQSAVAGSEWTANVHTYNTHLSTAESKAWLKLEDNSFIPAKSFIAETDEKAILTFNIPSNLTGSKKVEGATLIISNDQDGSFIRPSSVVIRSDSAQSTNTQNWSTSEISGLKQAHVKGFPFRLILEETIRNIFYHVPLWFGMVMLYLFAVFFAIRFLFKQKEEDILKSYSLNSVGFLFGILGLLTGSVWAKNTWGTYWTGDIKLNMTAIAMLIYAAYFILWRSFKDDIVRNRIGAVYSIFAMCTLIPLIFVIPRLYDSLHPGNGGNPALGGEDLDNTMRTVFYPAVIGFTLLGLWLSNLLYRIKKIDSHLNG